MTSGSIDVCLLTGGTSGIGLAAGMALAASGAKHVMLVGRSPQRAAAAVSAARARFPACDIRAHCADVATPAGATSAVEACMAAFGRIDVLVSSAGGNAKPCLLHDLDIGGMPALLATITSGVMLPARAALPPMMSRKSGAIILVASDAGKVATPGESVIGAAMAAIMMFGRGLATEAKRSGIRANVVTPSIVTGTQLYDEHMADPFAGKLFAKAERLAHLGVAGAEDVAALIAFLAGPHASRITGQVVSVNGGISAA